MSYKELSSIFKIFSDPSRLEILDLLSCGELCACELLEHFQFSQPTLSHHMKSLIDNNLVTTRKNGNKHMYQLNHAILDDITQNLKVINTSNQRCLCKSMKSGEC
ncbi:MULTISPECIES: ArsR/SmtB family transcription factor [Mammaliicoccus]|jgi:ArsR family transcriptional regulator|uniref:Metalloregulator ArsR/SmtB family transcription factor n=1 Tax=Mammaliicoccus sciuri TaxID=1296 RepID=A0ABT7HZN8_MAMSC|nr:MULTISPECIES: metalloregulator ArsR/SmtB family transcription factor [Mammaliicoccus]KTT83069.1 ArsR family transcriptional regulator [Mammaliicoccus sciuri]MBA1397431.1 metalloregulator ArsR/SmtB family transcription factor [Mammaliicoccus sciuri]MBG9204498.1 winged helix-turn-helix transcriptional regulator [Mammaliicoccus sciuri]MBO1207167.1 winged helix-turn-helix transcriptional regulator [Mammaliicoccus sciuri]MBU6089530.1 metalloregulator ArsR/SmtB family transcription factor [Mammal